MIDDNSSSPWRLNSRTFIGSIVGLLTLVPAMLTAAYIDPTFVPVATAGSIAGCMPAGYCFGALINRIEDARSRAVTTLPAEQARPAEQELEEQIQNSHSVAVAVNPEQHPHAVVSEAFAGTLDPATTRERGRG
jgi:hypothetical protein